MIEENVVMHLVDSIKNGDTWVIIGLAIIAIIAIVRNAILPEIDGVAKQIVSSLAAALGGIAVLLAAGQVWWAALIIGLLAAPTSSGLVPLIRTIIRAFKKKPPSGAQRGRSNKDDRITPNERPVSRNNNTSLRIPVVLFLTLFLLFCGGCGGAQRPCNIEKTIVGAVGAGLIATDSAIGDEGGQEYETAMIAANGVHVLGQQAVAACELVRDGAAWQQWVMLALETVGAVVGVIEGASDGIEIPAPSELHEAVQILENEANRNDN